jgi:hypothetical protein
MELARLSARRRIMDSIRTTNVDSHGDDGFEASPFSSTLIEEPRRM